MDIQAFKTCASQAMQNGNATNVLHINNEQVSNRTWVAWGSRGSEMNRDNRATRQAFIEALKNQFGATRVLDLPKVILNSLNLSDFDLDENDRVRSDKPLTARRVICVTTAMTGVATLEERTAKFTQIVTSALTKKCLQDFVSLVKDGKLGTAKEVMDFVSRWFGGSTGDKLRAVMVSSAQDRDAFCRVASDQLAAAVRESLVSAGVTAAQLQPISAALAELSANPNAGESSLWHRLAKSIAEKMAQASDGISRESFDKRLGDRQQKLDALKQSELEGIPSKLMKTERGRDILLRVATFGLERLSTLSTRQRDSLDRTLSFLAENIKTIGADRAYILVHNLRYMIGDAETSVNRMQVRQVLGTILKQYTDLTDADLKQLSTQQLRDYALAAVDDSLVSDRETLTRTIHESAENLKAQNYTDAETRELMSFAHELNRAEPRAVQENAPVEPPPNVNPPDEAEARKAKSLEQNKVVCANLELLGKLFHREDVWTNDALGGAKAILDTLENNRDLVKTLADNWVPNMLKGKSFLGDANMFLFSNATVAALNLLVDPNALNGSKAKLLLASPFSGTIREINKAILEFSKATTQEAKMALCEKISLAVNDLTTGLTTKLQEMLTKNLDAVLKGEGGGPFKGLPPNQDPKDADLLALAKSRHPAPRHETKAQRQQREAAILAEYGKLVLDPQAGGIGALIRSLASNYVEKLDLREKRAMLSGALMSLKPDTLTEILQGKSVFDLASMLWDGKTDEVKNILLKKGEDGELTEAQKKAAGEIAVGIIKGSGPVLQKMIQMIGAEKIPKYLQQVVKDCKSHLKPIPPAYVQAKLAEVIRQSNGKIVSIANAKSIGAASIAQAFECTVTYRDGTTRQVVVKMLRPDVRGRMEREIAAIRSSVAGAGEGALRTLNARINSLMAELDFTEERQNIETCQSIYGKSSFKTIHSVKLAEGCPQLPDVLIMEKAPGSTAQDYMDETTKKLNALLEGHVAFDKDGHYTFKSVSSEEYGRIKGDLTRMYADVRKRQANLQHLMQTWLSNALFGSGKFHGDLHGGNIMVDNNGDMTFIDFGNAPTFSAAERKNVMHLIAATLRGKPDDILDAAMKLVSADSQQALTAAREALRAKFNALFGVGNVMKDMNNVGMGRLTAVFGELSRASVEIPASLYNFIEAFGRIQQLSSSMETTLQRISTALPYMRQHTSGEPVADPILPGRKVLTLDSQVDTLIQKNIDAMRKDHPGISELEIIQRLKESADNGVFDSLFDSFSNDNPVAHDLIPLCSKMISNEHIITHLFRTGQGDGLLINENDYENNPDKIRRYCDKITQTACENIDSVLGPYCAENPELVPVVAELKDLMHEAYGFDTMDAKNSVGPLLRFNLELIDLQEASKTGGKSLGDSVFLEKFHGHDLTPEQANLVARLNSRVRTILYKKVLPALTKIYKARMVQVISGFDLTQFPPPVAMSDTLKSSILWHIPSALGLIGGGNAICLGASKIWDHLTDKTVEIRANFKVELDTFRTFAENGSGRLRATKSKKLEPTTSMNTLSVHNAEAWRAFVESLCADMHISAEEFYKTAAGYKIRAILNLAGEETLDDVEQATPLTPDLVRQVLAARDMAGLDRSGPSFTALTTYFSPGTAIEDLSFEQFSAKLDEAFTDQFGQTMSEKLNFETLNLNETAAKQMFASQYGKVISRMSEIGAFDPYFAKTGEPPRKEDVQRWLIAAFLDVFNKLSQDLDEEAEQKVRTNFTLKKVFGGESLTTLRQKISAVRISGQEDFITALLLHANDDGETQDGLLQFICDVRKSNPSFQTNPKEEAIRKDEADRAVLNPAQIPPEVDSESEKGKQLQAARAGMADCVEKFGYRVWTVAADDDLYQRFKAANQPVSGELLADIQGRVRREIYAGHVRPPLDVEQETSRVIMYWTLKKTFENPPVVPPPEPEKEEEDLFSGLKSGFMGLFGGFFG